MVWNYTENGKAAREARWKLTESRETLLSGRFFFFIVLAFVLATDFAVVLDIPVLRQLLGFLFLTTLPGILIVRILKLNRLELVTQTVLCIGFSIAFIILIGLLMNSVYPLFSYDTPLSTNSLLISFSIILLILAAIDSVSNPINLSHLKTQFELNTREKVFLLPPFLFLLLSMIGIRMMNNANNNTIIMILLLLIPVYIIFLSVRHNTIPKRIYPPTILLIGISLMLLLGLRSDHVIGVDTHTEYYLFQQTFQNSHWQQTVNTAYDSCLSITILPSIYQSFISIDGEYLFKILYPILFAISPLVIYLIARTYVSSLYAFLAALFFESQIMFLAVTSNARTSMGILFFALAIMTIFHKDLSEFNRRLLFMIFAISCVLSHYSTSYVFFFLLILTFLIRLIIIKIGSPRGKIASPAVLNNSTNTESQPIGSEVDFSARGSFITLWMVTFCFFFIIFWHGLVVSEAFEGGINYITNSLESFGEFFTSGSREEGIQAAAGYGIGEKGIPQQMEFILSWLTIAFVAIGVVVTMVRHIKRNIMNSEFKRDHVEYLHTQFNTEFICMALVCVAMLAVAVAAPFSFRGYGLPRAYSQMLVVLSPFLVIGGIEVARIIQRRHSLTHPQSGHALLILAILIPYYLCITGAMYEFFESPRSMALNSEGTQYYELYVHEQEVSGANWLNEHATLEDYREVQVDRRGGGRLISQAGIAPRNVSPHAFEQQIEGTLGYIFLRHTNTVEGTYLTPGETMEERNLAELDMIFKGKNKTYTNGGSTIYN